tara:strand:+ start:28 stop:450 length:423 start_codon:yes stop_codon:yes gene_type:complete
VFELTYSSFAGPDLRKKDILEIERVSILHNSINDITGCLVCHNNEFVQILEGSESLVKELYAKITRDDRHRGICSVFSGPIEERQFKDWRMIYNHLSLQKHKMYNGFLFEQNLKSLCNLTKPKTRGSHIFWNSVAELTNI